MAFKEDESRSNDEALLLTESWESEVIVTTFVQLLESLITNRNRALKKLHNIQSYIVQKSFNKEDSLNGMFDVGLPPATLA